MAGIICSLFLILSLWMTGSRSALVIRSESPGSSLFWDRDPLNIGKRALAFRKAGANQAAELLYLQGYDSAMAQRQDVSAVRYLMSAGACQFLDYHYAQALATFLRTRDLAESAGDSEDAGVIAFNLSSIYLQVWDLPSAVHAAQDGIAALNRARSNNHRAPLLLQIGRLHSFLKDGDAEPFFLGGIEAARAEGMDSVEAIGWDLLAEQRMFQRHWDRAEQALGQAYRLRTISPKKLHDELPLSYARLGALKLAQGDLRTAMRFTDRALARNTATWPLHVLLAQRGRIRLELGQTEGALEDLSAALEAATAWRAEVPAARSSLTATNIALENQIFDSFVEAAGHFVAEHKLNRKNPELAARAFQAVELNRAANLRQSLALAPVWREKLPPKYWELLGQAAEMERLSRIRPQQQARLNRVRLEITEMEGRAGFGFTAKKDEIFATRASLIHFQDGLSDSELFLSFFLGKGESYLWAVTRTSLRMFRLGDLAGNLAKDVQSYRQALQSSGSERGLAEAVRTGGQLYQRLFGQLGFEEKSKTAWLLSLDGPLFDVPFAALVTEQQGGKIVYLVEQHSLQIVPGALVLQAQGKAGNPATAVFAQGWFLGVGDPVYNRADPRWHAAPQEMFRATFWPSVLKSAFGETSTAGSEFGEDLPQNEQMERLVGSGREVENSASAWGEDNGTATVLTGVHAERDQFLKLLGGGPKIIHLATHAIIPPADREQGRVAFSMGEKPGSQFLAAPEIAMLRVPHSLVVMSGCATATGQVSAGAGLLGLTRAWLMAGASGVVATAWPVEDTSGEIFSGFYRRLRTSSPAEALRQTQIELAQEGTWRSAPAIWASYQLTGGAR